MRRKENRDTHSILKSAFKVDVDFSTGMPIVAKDVPRYRNDPSYSLIWQADIDLNEENILSEVKQYRNKYRHTA